MVSVESVELDAASLSTVTAAAPDRGRVFETVPEPRDRLAVGLLNTSEIGCQAYIYRVCTYAYQIHA